MNRLQTQAYFYPQVFQCFKNKYLDLHQGDNSELRSETKNLGMKGPLIN